MAILSASHPLSTLANGQPSPNPGSSQQLRYGNTNGGLVALNDVQLVEVLAHFARERIPERTVHAKAAGAFGYFEVLADVSDLTDASFLTGIGKKTPLLSRISTVGGEKGSADTVRDVHGWATKLYTEDGIQDLTFNNLPVFFIRDPIKFPSMNRSHKKNPRTNCGDWSMFWDYHVNNPEGIHALVQLFGERGIPASLKNINGFSVHTYTLNKADGSYVYVKWHFKPDAGIKTMPPVEAAKRAGENPDYLTQDLFEAIESGDFPTWSVYLQVMSPSEAKTSPVDIFDCTYVWPHSQYPLRLIGRITLDRNPENYFADIEQAAFSPSNMVPGVGPSADPVLQARMFSYPDAQRYRLGANYYQLPVNRPTNKVYAPYIRDGKMNLENYGGNPNYVGSALHPVSVARRFAGLNREDFGGEVTAFSTEVTDKDFVQARDLYHIMEAKEGGEGSLAQNIAGTLADVPTFLKEQVMDYFGRVDGQLRKQINAALQN